MSLNPEFFEFGQEASKFRDELLVAMNGTRERNGIHAPTAGTRTKDLRDSAYVYVPNQAGTGTIRSNDKGIERSRGGGIRGVRDDPQLPTIG